MLSPASMGESDSSDLDLDLKNHLSGQNSLPLGHTSVKSLSNKFKQDGNGAFKNLLSAEVGSLNPSLRIFWEVSEIFNWQ